MSSDVLGNAIQDFHIENKSTPIQLRLNGVKDDDLDPEIFFRAWEEMPELEQFALKMCRGKVLDVGAAAGCHSLVLQEMGLEVLAVEPSRPCANVMTARGVKRIQTSIVEEVNGEKFDTILLLMNGMGMAQKVNLTPDFLRNLASLLNDGGQIIGDSSDIIYTYEQEDGSLLIPSDKYYGEVLYELEYKGLKDSFDWLFIDPDTLRDAAEEADLDVKEFIPGIHYDYLCVLEKK